MSDLPDGIDVDVQPSGPGCVECLADGGWWLHLRRCAQCGHVGCCDSSPAQHATGHFHDEKHPVMQSYEPGESWFWSYPEQRRFDGPTLAAPDSRPANQPAPGPAGMVPPDWQNQLN